MKHLRFLAILIILILSINPLLTSAQELCDAATLATNLGERVSTATTLEELEAL